jgi:hypothetical protein
MSNRKGNTWDCNNKTVIIMYEGNLQMCEQKES